MRLLLLLCPLVAQASVLDIYGFNPRGTGMGNAHAAVADDYTAAFYNPAGLTRRKKVGVGASFIATFPELQIDRDYLTDAQREVPNELPPAFSGIAIGALFPLGGLIDNTIALGLSVYLPTLNLLRAEGLDPQIPQFYRYQNLPDKFVVLAALAVEPFEWLSLGAGLQVLATLDGGVSLDIELANRRVQRQSVEVDVEPAVAPIVGLRVSPATGLDIGMSFRNEVQLDYGLPVHLVIDDLIALDIDLRGNVLYVPDYLNIGAAYDLPGLDLLLSAEFSYARWSRAPDPSPTFTVDVGGELTEGLGLDERLDVGNGAPVDLRFRDVPIYKAGVEWGPHPQWRFRGGYTWRPSPAPVPTEAFNYIDNDAHVLSGGLGFSFADPLEIRRNPVSVDASYQATLMVDQDVSKAAAAADPVGDYQAGGVIHSVQISFRHDL